MRIEIQIDTSEGKEKRIHDFRFYTDENSARIILKLSSYYYYVTTHRCRKPQEKRHWSFGYGPNREPPRDIPHLAEAYAQAIEKCRAAIVSDISFEPNTL